MPFGTPAITDFCFLVENIEASASFYQEKLGFALRSRAEGFADFTTEHVALAIWEIDHIAAAIGISAKRSGSSVHKAVAAMEVARPEDVDAQYAFLVGRGVEFLRPPADYSWRARCVYFMDPDENLWEIYCWLDGRFGAVS